MMLTVLPDVIFFTVGVTPYSQLLLFVFR